MAYSHKSDPAAALTQPLAFGSHRSKLIAAIRNGPCSTRAKLSADDMLRLITWVDANAPYHSHFINMRPEKPAYDLPADAALSSTPAMLLSGASNLRDSFTLSQAGSREGLDWVLVLDADERVPAALRGEIEVALRSERTPRDYQRVLHSALEEIDRMTTMTEELLLISRAEAGLIALQREPVDVDTVVAAALDRLRHRIQDKELQVEHVTAPSNGFSMRLDRALLTRLVDELLDNAVTYSDPGGRIIVRNEHLDNRVRLVVEDNGPGIGAKDLPHLFEPYYRADLARTRGAGTGLGLTGAAAIARLHGGEIRAANRSEGGARFEVDFPIS